LAIERPPAVIHVDEEEALAAEDAGVLDASGASDGAQPSAVTYSRLGLLVVPTSIAAALVALMLVSPHGHI
jgi:hypothetical protein